LSIQLNLKKDLTLILNAESNALKKSWAKWHDVLELLKYGHFEDLSDINLDALERMELHKHLIAREVDMHGKENAGHRILVKMLQQSVFEEKSKRDALKEQASAGARGAESNALDGLKGLSSAEAERKRQQHKKELMQAEAERKRLQAEEKAARLRDAQRRKQAYLQRYHWDSIEQYEEEMARRREKAAFEAASPASAQNDDDLGDFDDFEDDFDDGDFDDAEDDDDQDDDEDVEIEVAKSNDHEGSIELTGSVDITGSIDLTYENGLLGENDGTEVPESNPIPSGLDMHRGEEGSALVQSSLGVQHSLELFAENSVETQSLRTKKAK
jgi:hypothetical protein